MKQQIASALLSILFLFQQQHFLPLRYLQPHARVILLLWLKMAEVWEAEEHGIGIRVLVEEYF